MTTSPRADRFRLLRLALLAGTAFGLAGTTPRAVLAEPPDDEIPAIFWQLAMLTPRSTPSSPN